MLPIVTRPTERGGYFPGARTNRGPRALVNANMVVICLYCKLLQSILCYQNAYNCTIFKYFFKFFLGENPQTPLCNKTKAFMQHHMYSDRYARGPKLKFLQGPIILSAALIVTAQLSTLEVVILALGSGI